VLGSLFTKQLPLPSHVSALSHTVSDALPQLVPLGSNASAGHDPAPSHCSAISHSPASDRHVTVLGSLFTKQAPLPSQLSGLSHTVSDALPQLVPLGSNASAGHDPTPSHISATSHSPASDRHVTVLGSLFTKQAPLPSHVSALSHTVSDALPQLVPLGSNASAGHEPAPSHTSATSHSPASDRHVTVLGSLFTKQLPLPSHVSGLSQTVSAELPHAAPLGAIASAGHDPTPSHNSATSHSPIAVRHVTVPGSLFTKQAPLPSHVSALSHTVSDALPHAVPAATF
jgi:hypothetical protein